MNYFALAPLKIEAKPRLYKRSGSWVAEVPFTSRVNGFPLLARHHADTPWKAYAGLLADAMVLHKA